MCDEASGGKRNKGAPTSSYPRVLLIVSGEGTTGGIQSYCQTLAQALRLSSDVDTVHLSLDGSAPRKIGGFARALYQVAAARPNMVVLSHIGMAPIGLVSRAIGVRFTVVAHGIEVWGKRSPYMRLALTRAAGVWTVSRFTEAQIQKVYPACRTTRVIGGAVSSRFTSRQVRPSPVFRILSVARAEHAWYKGIDTCIMATTQISRDHGVEYRIAGAGAWDLSQRQIRESASEVIRWLGEVDQEQLLTEYAEANVLVLVSRFRSGPNPSGEGLGLAVLEAAMMGTPAIGASVGGTAECIIDGVTGFLIPPDDPHILEHRLRILIEDPALRRDMGAAARSFATERFGAACFSDSVRAALWDSMKVQKLPPRHLSRFFTARRTRRTAGTRRSPVPALSSRTRGVSRRSAQDPRHYDDLGTEVEGPIPPHAP